MREKNKLEIEHVMCSLGHNKSPNHTRTTTYSGVLCAPVFIDSLSSSSGEEAGDKENIQQAMPANTSIYVGTTEQCASFLLYCNEFNEEHARWRAEAAETIAQSGIPPRIHELPSLYTYAPRICMFVLVQHKIDVTRSMPMLKIELQMDLEAIRGSPEYDFLRETNHQIANSCSTALRDNYTVLAAKIVDFQYIDRAETWSLETDIPRHISINMHSVDELVLPHLVILYQLAIFARSLVKRQFSDDFEKWNISFH